MTDQDAATGTPTTGSPFAFVDLRRRNGDLAGRVVLDAADLPLVAEHRWYLNSQGYAVRQVTTGVKKQTTLAMHRVILGLTPGDRIEADHISRDKLDNRRCNLRVVSHAQNMQNRPATGASSARGVYFVKAARRRPWRARGVLDGKQVLIGDFATEDEAAEAARAWRREHMPFATD